MDHSQETKIPNPDPVELLQFPYSDLHPPPPEEDLHRRFQNVNFIERNEEDEECDKTDDTKNETDIDNYIFPVRPEAEDCSYYMRTGNCKYGSSCKFNHPIPRINQDHKDWDHKDWGEERHERIKNEAQIDCRFFLRTGGCKYGNSCKFYHNRSKISLGLNLHGLPIRPGESECQYYMRNGSCKFGANCKFNHPDPASAGGEPTLGFSDGGSVSSPIASQASITSWSSPRGFVESAPYAPIVFLSSQEVTPHNSEWSGYQAPVYSPEWVTDLPTPHYATSPATETSIDSVDEFPERPGQAECSYYLGTGDRKYKYNFISHHPKDLVSQPQPYSLTDKGLPLRPGQNICTHYSRYGICKFGPSCKFDHPIDLASSPVHTIDEQPTLSSSLATEEEDCTGDSDSVTAHENGDEAATMQQPL